MISDEPPPQPPMIRRRAESPIFHEPETVFCECPVCRKRQREGAWVFAGIAFALVCTGVALGLVIASNYLAR